MDIDHIEDHMKASLLEGRDAPSIDSSDNPSNLEIPTTTQLSISSHASEVLPGKDIVPQSRTTLHVLNPKELSEGQEVIPEGGDTDNVKDGSANIPCGNETSGEAMVVVLILLPVNFPFMCLH